MLLRVELSVSGLEKLTAFCKENIRPDLDAAETAFELMQTGAYGSDNPVRIRIREDLAKDGQGAEIVFSDKDDFSWFDPYAEADLAP